MAPKTCRLERPTVKIKPTVWSNHTSSATRPQNRSVNTGVQLYKTRHKVENMFGKLKDWRRVATRYDRCAHTYFSAICIAATVIFYLN
ncbi:MAG: transposase [Rhodospirillaceae bacterium]